MRGKAKRRAKGKAALCAWCRGEGLGYAAIRAHEWLPSVRASVRTNAGASVPCAVYPVESNALRETIDAGVEALWVVVVPILSVPFTLSVYSNESLVCKTMLTPLASKLASRSLSLRRPGVAAALRGFERRYGAGRSRVTIDQVWPAEGQDVVWRIRATLCGEDAEQSPVVLLFDGKANELVANTVVMEDQLVSLVEDDALAHRLVTFSCRLPQSVRSFYAVAGGFDGINASRAVGMLEGICGLTCQQNNDAAYAHWFEEHRATPAELEMQRHACVERFGDDRPTMGLVVPVAGPPKGLAATLESIRQQTYDRWNVCVVCEAPLLDEVQAIAGSAEADKRVRVIAAKEAKAESSECLMSQGISATSADYVGVIRCADTLEPDTLWHFALVFRNQEHVQAAYCDEDRVDGLRAYDPSFKTFPNYGSLYGSNYVGHLLMIARGVLEAMELPGAQAQAVQEYDLALKTFELAREVAHVPRVLYHQWSECDHEDTLAGQRVLKEHLERRGIPARVEEGPLAGTYRVRFCLPQPGPLVSIVIPTRDQSHLLNACVGSILQKTTYSNFEVVLVENNSCEPQTFALYDELCARDERVRVVTWEPPEPGGFNYSAVVNFGVSQSVGELVVLLNNDTEVIEPSWLEEMAGCLMRPEVGVVGAKLLFGDGLIQHVGMVANPEGNFCHVCQNLTSTAPGPGGRALLPGDLSMVTGACQMVRRSVFDELGGYDEDLAVGYNDGDFCLRARDAGYSVTLAAYALLHHREFSTRGRESTDARLRKRFLAERARMVQKHAGFFAQGDPAMNPNLNAFGSYFEL